MLDVLLDAIIDTAKLIPFLFITYLILEFIEHKAAKKTALIASKAGALGPLAGGLLGAVPQCGFSASAVGLYSGGLISVGTLIAVFLSTSDEMLPVMLSEQVPITRVLSIIGIKVACGILIGYFVDLILRLCRKTPKQNEISHLCEEEHCHCEKGILRSSLFHTGQIALFIFLFAFAIGCIIYFIGEDKLTYLASNAKIAGPFIAGLIGLIPNCAASVVLTELYIDGVIGTGSLLAGLLAGSGTGLLLLLRIHKNLKENLAIIGIVYTTGVIVGLLFDLLGITL